MPLSFLSSHITGTPDDSAWSEIYEYTPDDTNVLQLKGRLVIIINAQSDSSLQQFLAKNIFTKIKETYYSHPGNQIEALKETLNDLNPKEKDTICIAAITENDLYSVSFGDIQIILLRSGLFVTLLRGQKAEIKSVSGHIRSGDTIVFGTKRFFEVAGERILRSALMSHTVDSISSFLEPMIQVQENQAEVASYFFKIVEEREVQKYEESEIIQTPTPQSFLPGKPIYVKEERPFQEKRKTPIVLGAIFVFLLVGSIVWGGGKREERLKEEAFQNQVSSIQNKLDESKNLANINPEAAKKMFEEAQNEISNLPEGMHPEIQEELKSKIKEIQVEVLGEKHLDVVLFVDLSLLSDGFIANTVSVDGTNAYVLDKENKRIAKVSLSSKRAEIVVGPNIFEDTYAIATYADKIYGLSNENIKELTTQKTSISDGWNDALIYSYASNIYIIDKDSSEIYRYTRGDGGFSDKARWMNDGITAELSNVKQMIIDGSIWTIDTDSKILRFTNGSYWQFTPQSVYPQIEEITSLYTNDEQENLYILEASQKRVIVLTKQGEFLAQYYSEDLAGATSVFAQEEEKKLFVLTKDKLLQSSF